LLPKVSYMCVLFAMSANSIARISVIRAILPIYPIDIDNNSLFES
jgi:hypothetical protein